MDSKYVISAVWQRIGGLLIGLVCTLGWTAVVGAQPPTYLAHHCGYGGPLDDTWCGCTWGVVYYNDQPVSDAEVTITFGTQSDTVYSEFKPMETYPYYAFSAHDLGAQKGDQITIDITYGDHTASRTVYLWPDEMLMEQQENFVLTGDSPDLQIEAITLNPPEPAPGEPFDIIIDIANRGTGYAADINTYAYINPPACPPTNTTPFSYTNYLFGLPADDYFGWELINNVEDTAIDNVCVWVDRGDIVPENNDNNNLLCSPQCFSGDQYEYDNECSHAQEIVADGQPQTHTFAPLGDVDWVTFKAIAGVEYTIEALNIGSDANVMVDIIDYCASPPSLGGGQRFTWTCPTDGYYFLKIINTRANYDPTATEYTISISARRLCETDVYESDDSCNTARLIPTDGTRQRALFCKSADTDWVKFYATAGNAYTIQAESYGDNTHAGFRLLDRCRAAATLDSAPKEEQMTWNCFKTGTYYLQVQNANPEHFGTNETYNVRITETQRTPAEVEDMYEDDDSYTTATEVATDGTPYEYNIYPAGDADWVKFSATANTVYWLETRQLLTTTDTVMELYDTDGTTMLAWDDDSGEGAGSRLVWRAPAPDTYYLRLYHPDAQAAGLATSYQLALDTDACVPDSYEDDNYITQTRPIMPDETFMPQNFCPVYDEDWCALSCQPDTSYTIETTELGPDCDPVLHIYDDAGIELATNDDYGGELGARLNFTCPDARTYYLQVRPYNPASYGGGTAYTLQVRTGSSPIPTPTTLPPTPMPTSTPPYSEVKTLILTNRERLAATYTPAEATALLAQLHELATHPQVQGIVVEVEQNRAIADIYNAWTQQPTNSTVANKVAIAIRNLIMTYLQDNGQIEYLVIVGGDWIVPFYRLPDKTHYPESQYSDNLSETSSVGIAGRHDQILTDNYYAARHLTWKDGQEIFVPDLAIGRLVETPTEISAYITQFLTSAGTGELHRGFVSGYHFVKDAAEEICTALQDDLGSTNTTCLIGDTWSASQLKEGQLPAPPTPRPDFQAINGHANHHCQGTPEEEGCVSAADIVTSSTDLGGVLVQTVGCHSGLNVPPGNPLNALDLAQAYQALGASYVANTGYGWGIQGGIGLSEALMRDYARTVLQGPTARIGPALQEAKAHYYHISSFGFDAYDDKIMTQATLYGLPMYELQTGSGTALAQTSDLFPAVSYSSTLPTPVGDTLLKRRATLSLSATLFTPITTAAGDYYTLYGFTAAQEGTPLQPLYFRALPATSTPPIRGLVLTGGHYQDISDFTPLIARAENEFSTTAENAFNTHGWYPRLPCTVQYATTGNGELACHLGQYDSLRQAERLYTHLNFDLYYSASPDRTPPAVTALAKVVEPAQVRMKVKAHDSSGIARVTVLYTTTENTWAAVDLTYADASYSWQGTFPGDAQTLSLVQVMDGAGNVWADYKIDSDNIPTPIPTSTPPADSPSLTPAGGWVIVIFLSLALGYVSLTRRRASSTTK